VHRRIVRKVCKASDGSLFGVMGAVLLFVFPFAMAFAAATDLLTMRISNVLTLGLAAAFLLVGPVAGLTSQEMLLHLAAGSAMLLAGLLLFSLGWVGGGDAKLLAAASLWLGPEPLVPFLLYVAVFGGALALAILAYRRYPAGALPLPGWAARLHAKGEGIPYGVAIAAGALAIYPSTAWYAVLAG
jgi:prepilin peptidase CpaA